MSDIDFQTTVLTALGELKAEQAETKTEVRNIVARLDKVNGSVARHEKELREHEVHLAERKSDCPLVDAIEVRIRPLEAFMISEQAADRTSKTWLDRLWPLVWAAAGAIAILLLGHSDDLLKHFGK